MAAFGEKRPATSVVAVVLMFAFVDAARAEAGDVAVGDGGTILMQSSARAKKPRPRGHVK